MRVSPVVTRASIGRNPRVQIRGKRSAPLFQSNRNDPTPSRLQEVSSFRSTRIRRRDRERFVVGGRRGSGRGREGGSRTSRTSFWKSAPATSFTARVVQWRALDATRAGAANALRFRQRARAFRDTRPPSTVLGAKVAAMSAFGSVETEEVKRAERWTGGREDARVGVIRRARSKHDKSSACVTASNRGPEHQVTR